MTKLSRLLRTFLTLGTTIIPPLPNNILNGQVIDATPVMADFNAIVSAVNANAAATTDVSAAISSAIAAALATIGVRSSFTPGVAFGGASTGITYLGQNGYYTKIGNYVLFHGSVWLNSNGSAVGVCTITGLPFPAANISLPALVWAGFVCQVNCGKIAIPGSAGATMPFGLIAAGASVIQVMGQVGSAPTVTPSAFNSADFTSGSSFQFSGLYTV